MTEPTPFCLIKRSTKRYGDVIRAFYESICSVIGFMIPSIRDPLSFCVATYFGSFVGILLMLLGLFGHTQVSHEFGMSVIIGWFVFPILMSPFYAAFYDCYLNNPKERSS